MTLFAAASSRPVVQSPLANRWRVVVALARTEARRTLRSPWLLAAVVLTAAMVRSWLQPSEWNGDKYGAWFLLPAAGYIAVSLIVAGGFHRQRTDVASGAPVDATDRCLGVALGAWPAVALTLAFTTGLTAYIWWIGGVDLGTEPGRTLHAHPTAAELSQPVAATLLAVAAGAAVGRRVRHRVTAAIVLLVGWLPVTVTAWAFTAPGVAAFSILQTQPVYVEVGPASTDPLTFPSHWLLEPPSEYQDHWARLVVSESLAWWHTGWLLGLSALVFALALPGGRARRLLVLGGTVLAAVSVGAQLLVYPS
ncbi:hypothetical protein [Nocardioides insulae]|uniref:hypothetical protein n=1 Tax=Nocardioides insulae TaxID=394734 RepID=UPI00042414B2|nr:hypothetical protein [Nocardioides insulae]